MQYNRYVKYQKKCQKAVAKFKSFNDFLEANPDTEIGEGDFSRFKTKFIMKEPDYWLAISKQNSIRNNMFNKAINSIEGK